MRLTQLLIVILFVASYPAQAIEKQIAKELGKLRGGDSGLGVYIAEESGEVIYASNPNKLFVPASITKVVTGIVALEELGPATRVKTQLGSVASQEGATLKGPLYLVGAGDPGFVSENMWVLVNNFIRTGITKVEGDIVVDDSLFDKVRFDQTRLKNRVDRAYDAPVGAMSFNWNSVNVFVRPALEGKTQAQVILDPQSGYLDLDAKVTSSNKPTDIRVSRVELKGKNRIMVRGNINSRSKERVNYVSISDPDLWSGHNLITFLKERGIKVTGQVRSGKAPSGFKVLAESESKPVAQMVADMNKFSNNFVAEMLVKLIGAQSGGPGASIAQGNKAIGSFLKKKGIDETQIKFLNPSGLTRDNQFSAQALWRLLAKSHRDLRVNGEVLSSLPLAGVDGTLKSRLTDPQVQGSIRAKTGYLNSVVSLAGYYTNESKGIVPFVFIYNGPENDVKVRDTIDRVLTMLVKQR